MERLYAACTQCGYAVEDVYILPVAQEVKEAYTRHRAELRQRWQETRPRAFLVFDYSDSMVRNHRNDRTRLRQALEVVAGAAPYDLLECYFISMKAPFGRIAKQALYDNLEAVLLQVEQAAASEQPERYGTFLIPTILNIINSVEGTGGVVPVFLLSDGELFDQLLEDPLPSLQMLELVAIDLAVEQQREGRFCTDIFSYKSINSSFR